MSYRDCINEISKAAGGRLTEADIAALEELLSARADRINRRAGGTMSQTDALANAARELGEEERRAAMIEKRNTVLNLNARIARRSRIQAAGDPVLGVQAEIHGINTPIKGGKFSAEAEGKELARKYFGGATIELERAGLYDVARSGTLEREWVAELAELNKADGKPGISGSKPAREISEILNRYQSLAKANLNKAGGDIGDYEGFVAHTAHDPDRIYKAGYDAWRTATLPLLDADRTFDGVADQERFMRGVFNGLVTGVHLTAEGGQGFKDPAFTGPGNLSKRLSQDRILHFRDSDAWLDYQKQFGQPSALQAVMGSFNRAARDTALMRRWGTNPRAEFDGDLRWLKEQMRDGDTDAVRKLSGNEHDLQNRFAFLDGTADRPANRLGARVGSYARLVETVAKLGNVAFTHFSSAVTKSAELRYHGVGLLQGYGDFLQSFTRGRGTGETRQVMDLLGAGLEGMQRDILSRFQPDDALPGTASKIANLYFKLNGLTYMLNAQKAGAEFTMARRLGMLLDRDHDALPEETKRDLLTHDITPEQWNSLRQAPDHPEINGRKFLTPDAAHRMVEGAPDDREALALRLASMYGQVADSSIVTPGIPEKALLLQGTRPGTPAGEALRFIAQFKQWPAAAVRQGLGRELYGGQTKLAATAGILHMALGSTIVGYLIMSLKSLAQGRTPPDPRKVATWGDALAQGGGFGIMADYLFGEYDRTSRPFGEALLGPVLGQGLDSVVDIWNKLKAQAAGEVEGHPVKAAVSHEALKLALDNLPFHNLFYAKAALDYMFLYQVQEALNPGFLRRYERNVQQKSGAHFIVPPSSMIPYGGGTNRLLQGGR